MKNALWFSRHQPTDAQLADTHRLGIEIVDVEWGREIASHDLLTEGDVEETLDALKKAATALNAEDILGVWPVPLQERILAGKSPRGGRVKCWAAWNGERSLEGGKPTFKHLRWCHVGQL